MYTYIPFYIIHTFISCVYMMCVYIIYVHIHIIYIICVCIYIYIYMKIKYRPHYCEVPMFTGAFSFGY